MVKYIRFLVIVTFLFLGTLFDFHLDDNSSNKGLYYDHVEYSDNVFFNKIDGLDLNYSAELTNPGDFYYIDFDIINDSNVDMKILELNCPKNDKYISYKLTYRNGSPISSGDIITKGKSVGLTYVVSYNNKIDQDEYLFDSSFNIQYEQVI